MTVTAIYMSPSLLVEGAEHQESTLLERSLMSTILETHQDPSYEPSQSEIVEYGKWLGMQLPGDEHLLWIAREGLKAPLPEHWKACKSEKGELYYFNFKSGQSIWDHPLDDHYKELFKKEKENPSAKSRRSQSPATTEVVKETTKKDTDRKSRSKEVVVVEPEQQAGVVAASKPSTSVLPPSGKAAPTKLSEKSLPSLAKPSSHSTAASVSASSASSEDERTSQDSASSRRATGTKLKELKTLKTKKDMPGELRLDSLDVPLGSIAPTTISTTASILTSTRTPQHQSIPVETLPVQSAPKCSPISILSDASGESPISQDIARKTSAPTQPKKAVASFTTEEIAAAQEGKKQQVQAELVAELERFRTEEAARSNKLKEEYAAQVDANLRKSKDAMKQRNDQLLANFELELREDLRDKKAKLSRSFEEELAAFKKHEQDLQTRRIKVAREEIESHLSSTLQELKSTATNALQNFERCLRAEQDQFVALVGTAMESEKRLAESEYAEQVKMLKAQLHAEQNMVNVRIREIQGECNARVSVLKMDNEAAIEALQRQFEDQKAALIAAQEEETQSLVRQLKAKAEAQLRAVQEEYKERAHSPPALTNLAAPKSASPSLPVGSIENNSNTDESSDSSSLLDLANSLHAATQTSTPKGQPLPEASKGPVAPLNEKVLSGSLSSTHTEDLRSLITEALREVFKGSPFIVPSPGSQNPSVQVSPTSFGREIDHNTLPAGGKSLPHQAVPPLETAHLHSVPMLNVSVTPESFQEQRKLLADERRRLMEAKTFVDSQRAGLEERRAQLKAARHHWKVDILAAKAQGVAASSKKGMLLQKVHKVLDKQAVGLQHDDNLLKDSEHWLKMKEQRLLRLEEQMDEQERSRYTIPASPHDVSAVSVDTTALITGFFKPRVVEEPPRVSAAPGRRELTTSTPPTRSISPMLSKALERIERRLEKVASLVAVSGPGQHRSSSATNDHHGTKRRDRSSRSSSRTRHVDFTTTAPEKWESGRALVA